VGDEQLQQNERGGLGVPQGDEDGRKLDKGIGVVRQADPVVPKDVAQDREWNSAGLIIDDVPLQAVDGPEIVQSESDKTKVGFAGALTSHLAFVFFIVSKERVARNYSNVEMQRREYPVDFSYNFLTYRLMKHKIRLTRPCSRQIGN
jgi:hypothetical protein